MIHGLGPYIYTQITPRTLHLPEARAGHYDNAGGLHQPQRVELVRGGLLRGGLRQEARGEGDLLCGGWSGGVGRWWSGGGKR